MLFHFCFFIKHTIGKRFDNSFFYWKLRNHFSIFFLRFAMEKLLDSLYTDPTWTKEPMIVILLGRKEVQHHHLYLNFVIFKWQIHLVMLTLWLPTTRYLVASSKRQDCQRRDISSRFSCRKTANAEISRQLYVKMALDSIGRAKQLEIVNVWQFM